MAARYLVGDVFDRLRDVPDGSVDLVFTSPPFLALRSYLPDDDPAKTAEIGSEPTPADFLDTMLALTGELRRVLAPHGSICVELGDTYAGSGGAADDHTDGGLRKSQPPWRGSSARAAAQGPGAAYSGGSGWPLPKSLAMIPELYAASLAYGRNLLTGEESPAGQWRIRNVVAWVRPNPPVGHLGDKFRPGTSYMTIATINRNRYFDLDAVRTPHARDYTGEIPGGDREFDRNGTVTDHVRTTVANPAGAPPLDWWEIPTQPYKGAHFAAFPPALVVRPVRSMCPKRVCTSCGEPSRRIVVVEGLSGRDILGRSNDRRIGLHGARPPMPDIKRHTRGWTECGCGDGCEATTWRTEHEPVLDENTGEPVLGKDGEPKMRARRVVDRIGRCRDGSHWRRGHVLDPFAGTGTTLAVASSEGRDSTGIDLDRRNVALAFSRLGGALDVDGMTVDEVVDLVLAIEAEDAADQDA